MALDTDSALVHKAVKVTRLYGKRMTQRVVRVTGIAGRNGHINCYNNSLGALYRGLMERVYYVKNGDEFVSTPQPLQNAYSRCEKFRLALLSVLPRFASPVSREAFVGYYQGSKRKRYAAAVFSLHKRPLCRKDATVETFVKAELYNFEKKFNPCPRLIQPRRPRYNVELGRYIKPMEKRIYKAIDKVWGGPTVYKCYNPFTRGERLRAAWDSFSRPVAIGLDASRFDQHTSVEALLYEHSVYAGIYGDDKYLSQLLEWQRVNKGVAKAKDGVIKYSVVGKRMSGDMNTALGNVIIMCSLVHAYIEGIGIKAKLANDGDDCVLFLEQSDLSRLTGLSSWFLDMGYTMTVEPPAYVFEHIEFCQSHPVWLCDRWVMVRNVTKCIKHDLHAIDRDWATVDDILAATALCGLSIYKGCPVLQSHYESLKAPLDAKKLEKFAQQQTGFLRMAMLSGELTTTTKPITDLSRVSFWRAFGIVPSEQEKLESSRRGVMKATKLQQTLDSTTRNYYVS